ncbi:MAG: rhodanese-like domain-containing protein [Flavobacteriaceae bacterium]|nr:rhodanese-like domain-containing protein [Flavobacteriaceae bacterium]
MKKIALTLILMFLITVACQDKSTNDIHVITVEQMNEVLDSDNLQLVDVRTLDEYRLGHIGNAQNICVTNDDFQEKAKLLDKNKPVYLYCKRGGRSAKAAKILKEMGFKEIYDIKGGMGAWESKGFKTNKSTP